MMNKAPPTPVNMPLIDVSEWVYETPIVCCRRSLRNASPPEPPSKKMRMIQSVPLISKNQKVFLPMLPRNPIHVETIAGSFPSCKPRYELPLLSRNGLDLETSTAGKLPSLKPRNKLRTCSIDPGYARSLHLNDDGDTEQKLSIGAKCA